jgi:hypothetical protein
MEGSTPGGGSQPNTDAVVAAAVASFRELSESYGGGDEEEEDLGDLRCVRGSYKEDDYCSCKCCNICDNQSIISSLTEYLDSSASNVLPVLHDNRRNYCFRLLSMHTLLSTPYERL